MRDLEEVRQAYEHALDHLTQRLQTDTTLVAAVVWGSLAYDEVWERSDIDLTIVRDDRKARSGSGYVSLDALGINVHAQVTTREAFRKDLQSSVLGWGSVLTLGRILFTRDDSLRRIFEEVQALGERDRRIRLLGTAATLTTMLDKVEKWLVVKKDAHYATVWLCSALQYLATVIVLQRGVMPTRESIRQAVELDGDFFAPLYRAVLDEPKTVDSVEESLRRITGYLDAHLDELFGPIMDYLSDEATIRSVSDIEHHFSRRMDARMVTAACEWLAARGVIERASAPHHINQHSRVTYDEVAFAWKGPPR